jgi:hypothetical protein
MNSRIPGARLELKETCPRLETVDLKDAPRKFHPSEKDWEGQEVLSNRREFR